MKRSTPIPNLKSRIRNRNPFVIFIIAVVGLGVFGTGMSWLEQSAKDEETARKRSGYSPSLVGRVNPFLSAPSPTPTPELSKEYIYAGSRLLAVEDANANAAPPADLAVWRPSSGVWWVLGANQQSTSQQWGLSGDVPVPGDYDGDGKTDFSIFRPTSNAWWIMKSSDGGTYSLTFGASGDKTAQADFDGDGRTDAAVYRPSIGTWYILKSSDNQSMQAQFGLSSDDPAPADYDGDGRADICVRRDSNTTFYSANSSNGQLQQILIGTAGDVQVSSDYDGDGRADDALFRSSNASSTTPSERRP